VPGEGRADLPSSGLEQESKIRDLRACRDKATTIKEGAEGKPGKANGAQVKLSGQTGSVWPVESMGRFQSGR
jgi:hypothetical protein